MLQTNQISAPQSLAAGQRCYVELLHKESTNADHGASAGNGQARANFSIVPGAVLMQPQADAAQPSSSSLFNTLATEHPYLGVSRARFTWLKQQYQSPSASAVKSRAQAIVSSANGDLTAALDAGRWGRDRVQRLAVAWWLTGNSNYAAIGVGEPQLRRHEWRLGRSVEGRDGRLRGPRLRLAAS